jgi:hypothetical protein
MQSGLTVVVGGGAAGICAAISKARTGGPIIICEGTTQLGKKILASGNGRCNLLNDKLSEAHYNDAARGLVKSVYARFGEPQIVDFFEGLGLKMYSQDGRVFPVTNQSATVLRVLEMELERLSVRVEYGFHCVRLSFSRGTIVVCSDTGKTIECQYVVMTGGGKSYPALGSDGSMYQVAENLGHTIVEPVPSAVPLVVKNPLCHLLQGQRISAGVRSIIDGREGKWSRAELLFTRYGLSGTAILDASEAISVALNRHHQTDVSISVDMVPFMDAQELKEELRKRTEARLHSDDMLTGILPNKLCHALRGLFERGDLDTAARSLKDWRFRVQGTRGWNEAEFTSGGVDVSEVRQGTLESKLRRGVYLAGEILDVDGPRGGYNLGWAWASGLLAGLTE